MFNNYRSSKFYHYPWKKLPQETGSKDLPLDTWCNWLIVDALYYKILSYYVWYILPYYIKMYSQLFSILLPMKSIKDLLDSIDSLMEIKSSPKYA